MSSAEPKAPGHAPAVVMVGDVPDPVGGVAQVCVQVCNRLHQVGVPVHFIDTEQNEVKLPPVLASYQLVTPSLAALPRLVRAPGVIVEFLRVLPLCVRTLGIKRTLYVLVLASHIAGTVIRSRATLVLAHHAGIRGMAAVVAGAATRCRVSVMVHGAEFTHPGWKPALPLARYVVEHADLVITPSAYTRDLCADATGRRDDIEVVYNGVDHERFHPAVPSSRAAGSEQVVLFVGQLHPRKGPTVLAAAIPLVKARAATRYVFVGPDMGEEAALRRTITEAGVDDRTEIRGQVDAEELPGLYASADVFVFPTTWGTEGFGLVAAEAMACGTPVVASRIAAIPEVVTDGETGLLFEPGDATDLAAKLTQLLNDDELRHAMSEAGARSVQRFSWESLTNVIRQASAPR